MGRPSVVQRHSTKGKTQAAKQASRKKPCCAKKEAIKKQLLAMIDASTVSCDCCALADPQVQQVAICDHGVCGAMPNPVSTARKWLYIQDGVLGWGIP